MHVTAPARRRWHAGVVAFGAVTAWWVASPGWGRLTDHIVGDNGDAMWQLSVMRWTLDGLWSLRLPWTPPMFFPTTGTYAYSDPMLTQAVVAAPFRALGASPALLANIVLLLSWTAGVYLAWRLLVRVGVTRALALAGATAWAFSELRVATVPLFQLVTAAALLPFVFERLLATLERPSVRSGAVLGVVGAAAILAALYYGPLLGVAVPVAAVAWFAVARQRPTRAHLHAAVVAGVIVGVAVVPLAVRYEHVHRRDHLDRKPEAAFSATAADLTKVASHHGLLADLPGLGKAANGERALFPGLLVVAGLPAAAAVVVRRRWSLRPELAALVAAGVAAYLLATGSPLRVLDVLPGFSGIRAPVRFAVLGHLALVAVACCLLDAALRRWSQRVRVVAIVALVAVSLVDAGSWLPTAKVPAERSWRAVNEQLRRMPPGPVVELPILASADGVADPRIEAPRLYVAAIDGNPRVNGYSGFQPPGYADLVATLNRFPAPDAVATLRRLGVRYVVLRTAIVGYHPTDRIGMLRTYGTTDLSRLQASAELELPDSVRRIGTFGSAVLLEV